MSEENTKPEIWRELLQKERTKVVPFQTAYGTVEFTVRLPGWMELEKLRDQCTIIDIVSQKYNFDQPKFALLKLKASILKHPFPPEQLDAFLQALDTVYYNALKAAVEELEHEANIPGKN